MAEDELLAGRVAIVTGAASGMGRVMARALAGAGAKIAGVDVDAAGLDRLAAERVLARKFLRIATDVSKTAECRRAVQQVMETFGALDILINCAGVSMSTAAGHRDEARVKFFEADPEGWQRILAINTIGAFLMAVRGGAHDQTGMGTHYPRDDELRYHAGGRIIRLRRFQSWAGGKLRELQQGSRRHGRDREHPGPGRTGFFPPGKPRPPILLDPEIMAVPVVWLASSQSDGISACRFIARDWDRSLPTAEAAARARAPAAWPALAQAASAARGHPM
jgi:hypothetical protein